MKWPVSVSYGIEKILGICREIATFLSGYIVVLEGWIWDQAVNSGNDGINVTKYQNKFCMKSKAGVFGECP